MLKEDLIIFNRGSIATVIICLRKCVGRGSSTQVNDFEVEINELMKFVQPIGSKRSQLLY